MSLVNKMSDSAAGIPDALQESVEMQIANWIQRLAYSNSELVPALRYLRRSYRASESGPSLTDVEKILWQLEQALEDAEALGILGLSWLRRTRNF
jgi:hypothetical protein